MIEDNSFHVRPKRKEEEGKEQRAKAKGKERRAKSKGQTPSLAVATPDKVVIERLLSTFALRS
jgi:hypothetical protein